MKLWQKLYLMILSVILLLVNVGLYGIFYLTHQGNISIEQNRTMDEFYALQNNIAKDVSALINNDRDNPQAIGALIKSYEGYYQKEQITLEAWLEGDAVYPAENDRDIDKLSKDTVTIQRQGGKTKAWICSTVSQKDLVVYFSRPLTEIDAMWDKITGYFILGSVLISLVLAVLLYLLLRKGMAPVGQLTKVVKEIANGTLSARVNVKGKDEIAILGNGVNHMAQRIENAMEDLKEENEIRQNFIDNLAHELRTPLTSIYGFAEYLSLAKTDEEQREEALSYIMSETKRMQDMTQTLMSMALLRQEEIEMDTFSMKEMIENIKHTEAAMWQEKGIVVEFGEQVDTLYGNSILLESLVRNLIHNSIQALAEQKNPLVTVESGKIEKGIEIRIKDNGCGMTEEEIAHIFEPFYRVDKARSRENGGAGLGLSLCQQILQVHGGTLVYESEKGAGTTAIVHLRGFTKNVSHN